MLKDREEQFTIKLTKEQGARYAIMPGDPGRVELIAKYLDNPMQVVYNREYNTYSGFINGEKVLVISSGIGGPSAAICIEELAKIGVDTIVRVGTCGGMQMDVEPGDVIIANSAIRQEGTTKEYMPPEFPAVAHIDVLNALIEGAKSVGCKFYVGIVQSKDSFYGQHAPETMGVYNDLKSKWEAWIKGGCLASEMECSTLYVVGALRKLRTGAVFNCIWNQECANAGVEQTDCEDTTKAIEIAIKAISTIIENDKKK